VSCPLGGSRVGVAGGLRGKLHLATLKRGRFRAGLLLATSGRRGPRPGLPFRGIRGRGRRVGRLRSRVGSSLRSARVTCCFGHISRSTSPGHF
jgi:hypothetical protein